MVTVSLYVFVTDDNCTMSAMEMATHRDRAGIYNPPESKCHFGGNVIRGE